MILAGCSSGIIADGPYDEQGRLTTPRKGTQLGAQPLRPQAPVITFGATGQSSAYSGQPLQMTEEQNQMPPLTVVDNSFVPPHVKVALLVPLSGRNAALGQAMVNAAQLAVFDIAPDGFELLPRDTGINTVQAVRAATGALAAGANFVIGPLFAADVAAVRPVIQKASVNMLALSTDITLAQPGAYVMGFAPAPQVERVVSYAAARGYRQFAALVPSGPYGQLVRETFEKAVAAHGANLIAVERVSNLAYLATQKDSIEVLLLPFGGSQLKNVVQQLEKAGFTQGRIQLLGTGLWDTGFLGIDAPFLRGGWYATAEPEVRERFINMYADTYGDPPPRLATLAYDATALASVLVKTGRGFDETALTNPVGFAGLDGVFRLNAQGQVERGLAISEITETGRRTIHPAPKRFSAR